MAQWLAAASQTPVPDGTNVPVPDEDDVDLDGNDDDMGIHDNDGDKKTTHGENPQEGNTGDKP